MIILDKYQKIISLVGIICFVLSLVFLTWNSATATPVLDENGATIDFQYQALPSTLFSIFAFFHVACLTWFFARLLTYKMRQKEDTGY